MDMNKLSYTAFGNIVLIMIVLQALLFNLFPFDLLGFILCVLQIPIYLICRHKFEEAIHAKGLNLCCCLTNLFYLKLFTIIKLSYSIYGFNFSLIVSISMCILGCYATSTMPNRQNEKGKLFFGRKPEEGKYKNLYTFMRFNPYDDRLVDYENNLKKNDSFRYTIFKSIFRDFNTWEKTMEIVDIYDLKKLDRELYSIYKTLEYVLGLDKID